MPGKYKEEDLSKVRPISIKSRVSKVTLSDFVDPKKEKASNNADAYAALQAIFPSGLAGVSFKRFVKAIQRARDEQKEILWLIGAHVIKCGLSLYVNSLIDKGYITALATTGAATIHDLELAFFGETSEDVARELPLGRFGMSGETSAHYNAACALAGEEGLGLGEGIGRYIEAEKAPNDSFSVFAQAYRKSVPATVHVAFGTDIVHQHPAFPAALVGELTMRDFRILTHTVGRVFDGGVVIVMGSAVVLPEVFLKAVAVNYNLGRKPANVTAASFDMLSQYRVRENILTRPFQNCGESHSFIGHHEIMLPLLYSLLVNA
ncbi:MAG: hypothetical protein ABIA59_08065 [Candidatus Latescibacterota bacterium]